MDRPHATARGLWVVVGEVLVVVRLIILNLYRIQFLNLYHILKFYI